MNSGTGPDTEADSHRSRSGRRTDGGSAADGESWSRLVVDVLEEMETPVTIDELTDELLARRDPESTADDIESWADLHEQLYVVDLPVLHRTGRVEFEASKGLVSLPDEGPAEAPAGPEATADGGRRWGRTLLAVALTALSPALVALTRVGYLSVAPTTAYALAGVALALALGLAYHLRSA